ncbi:MAG: hypothetical protein IPM92_04005 [Saprospiraceae bacterium]|nr:hypothetical protein [Saprospiraceae bacterium]
MNKNVFTLIISYLMISMLSLSCSGSKTPAQEEYTLLGDGGGFTGVETIYKVSDNGRIEKSGEYLGRLSKEEISQLRENKQTLQLDQIEYLKPGNIYHLLEFNKGGVARKLVWDPYDPEHPKALELYYNHLFYLIKKHSK